MSEYVVAGMRKTPTYRWPLGAIRHDSKVIMSFSLDPVNAAYLRAIPKGEKSAAVNRMLHAYRTKGDVLRERIKDLEAQLAYFSKKNEAQMGGKTRKRGFLSWLFRR